MKSQWECLLQNLGEWQGSFTRLSPSGEELEDAPTVVTLEGVNENQTIRQTIQRLTPAPETKVLEYSTLGRGILLLETGAFSQGSMQFGPFSEFGAELGLIAGDRRLRLVQLFNPQGQLDRLTLIRERRAGSAAPERPALTLEDLLGIWQGEAVTVYPDWSHSAPYPTALKVEREDHDRLRQELVFGDRAPIISTATIHGSRLTFSHPTQSVQLLLLPDGSSSTSPTQLSSGQAFFLEVGWLLQPDQRQRLIRSYDDKGTWMSLTLVTERKVQQS